MLQLVQIIYYMDTTVETSIYLFFLLQTHVIDELILKLRFMEKM